MQVSGAEPGARLVELLTERGETVASAESLTAGLVAGPSGTATRALELKGDRAAVRSGAVREVLLLALREIAATPRTPAPLTGAGGTVALVAPDDAGPHPSR